MRYIRHFIIFILFLCLVFITSSLGQQKSLADLYKTGKVRFVPEITIDDNTLPKDIFFVGYGDIAVDSNGNVYVLDSRAKDIKKFDASGSFMKLIGREGQGPGEFASPFRLACSRERFVVWDMRNMRFALFALDGEPIKSVRHSFLEKGNPMKIRALPTGEFIVDLEKICRDPKKPQDFSIELYSPEMELVKTIYSHPVWRNIWGIPNAPNIPLPFPQIVHWELSPRGTLIIGFSEKYEIDIYDINKGKLASFVHTYDPVEVTKEDKEIFFKNLTFTRTSSDGTVVREEPPPVLKEHTKFPEFKPAFNNIAVDSEGNILVCTFSKNPKEEFKYFDSFDPKGNFIARVRIESKHSFNSLRDAQIIDGCFWVRESDEDGFIKIIKYRIAEVL
jgi:hypothetical protein